MKKISTFILIIYFILSIPTITYSQNEVLPEFPTLESEYVVLMDADSGEVLYQNNGDAKCHPASTTKLLTALKQHGYGYGWNGQLTEGVYL